MATKYLDNLNPSAADTINNGTEAAPYLTLAYAESQCADGDTLLVGNNTTYDVGNGTALTINVGITLQNWNNRAGTKPRIEGGDATRLIYVDEASAVVIDGFELQNDRTGNGSYILQAHSTVRNLRVRNTDFVGNATLAAVGITSASSGTVIESTCTITMTLGGATYSGTTGAVECYAAVSLSGSAQAAFFISNGDSNGADFVFGGTINLSTINNYVVRCGATNSDADITIHSSFYLQSVPSNYTRATFDIQDPRTFTVQDGARIDTTGSTAVAGADVWVRAKTGVAGAVYIRGLEIDRGSISGYGIEIGDENPSSTDHVLNSFTAVEIENVHIRDGKCFGTAGTTQTHMIFIGNEKRYKIKNCFIEKGAYGIGIKGDDTADPSSYVYNCKVAGARLSNLKTKGVENTKWYNNYVVEDSEGGIGLDITENSDGGASGIGAGTIARNNIFVMDTEVAVNVDANSNLGNNDLDYNSYYLFGVNIGTWGSTTYTTLLQMQVGESVEKNGNVFLSELPDLNSSEIANSGTENYRAGVPLTNAMTAYDSTGADAVTISNATFNSDTPYRSRRKRVTT